MINGSIRTVVITILIGIFLKRYSITLGLWREKKFLQEKHFDGKILGNLKTRLTLIMFC